MTDWSSFFVVAASTIAGAGSMVLFFALGVRLGVEGEHLAQRRARSVLMAASGVCYAISVAAAAQSGPGNRP